MDCDCDAGRLLCRQKNAMAGTGIDEPALRFCGGDTDPQTQFGQRSFFIGASGLGHTSLLH